MDEETLYYWWNTGLQFFYSLLGLAVLGMAFVMVLQANEYKNGISRQLSNNIMQQSIQVTMAQGLALSEYTISAENFAVEEKAPEQWAYITTEDGREKSKAIRQEILALIDRADLDHIENCPDQGDYRTIDQRERALLPVYAKVAPQYEGVNAELLAAIGRRESSFCANRTSSKGALGIHQLMPATAEEMGVTNPMEVGENIMGSARLLSILYNQLSNETTLNRMCALIDEGSGQPKNSCVNLALIKEGVKKGNIQRFMIMAYHAGLTNLLNKTALGPYNKRYTADVLKSLQEYKKRNTT
ncbi:transglycosylase SLT domain-containing protein [Patescibacteria group bacterium]|nr:transglycosylase SLT domain-containing protein [Patescibacteria group bacterium]